MTRVDRSNLRVCSRFAEFIECEALPGTGVAAETFWDGLSALVHGFGPRNRELLGKRADLQSKINQWHIENRGRPHDAKRYKEFLEEIGYLLPEGGDFAVGISNVDSEIADIPGPQLVVPITNARFALNAANARWNSLYDALYGTDALGDFPSGSAYDPERGTRVVTWGKRFLDDVFKLDEGSHAFATGYSVVDGRLAVSIEGNETGLCQPDQLAGYTGSAEMPGSVLLRNNRLHVELVFDRGNQVGAMDPAGLADVILEAAVTTIMDCEDAVAVVDSEDKISTYRNWLGIMKGDLVAEVVKVGRKFDRKLRPDRHYVGPNGQPLTLKGRALLLVRNVGHLMTSPVALDREGLEVGEGFLDAMCTVMIALHDLKHTGMNSSCGSVYVVKPKLHGPEEVALTDAVFEHVEQVLGLKKFTVKIGIMDEERRTTVNLKECIRAARNRVAFINTGFLDRTGDEIHTSMEAGPFLRKADIKKEDWLAAYEDRNVDVGLACGLSGRAQIGKGMWAMPELMHSMLEQKVSHPREGANTAWVPSPTAATLHATHYHLVDVFARQEEIRTSRRNTKVARLLNIPLAVGRNWSDEEIKREIENNLQGILGYVVRWVDHGVGCSKVPDINNVALMEDRATCRISSQHLANWLHHGIVDPETVSKAMRRMAEVVDGQNSDDPNYKPMAPEFDGEAYMAAHDLVFKGTAQPSGYTEPVLHWRRCRYKQLA